MSDDAEIFDQSLIEAAFAIAGERGWRAVSIEEAAYAANLDIGRARARFTGIDALLRRLGANADRLALEGYAPSGSVRDDLFDLLMRRFDAFVPLRPGLKALLAALPVNPALSLMLTEASARSMGWLLAATGVEVGGLRGILRINGLLAVWLYALRAFAEDESPDLAATMAALDRGLAQAEKAAGWLAGSRKMREPAPFPEADEDFAGDDADEAAFHA